MKQLVKQSTATTPIPQNRDLGDLERAHALLYKKAVEFKAKSDWCIAAKKGLVDIFDFTVYSDNF